MTGKEDGKAQRERGGGTTWQYRKCVEIVGSYMFNGRSSLCAAAVCGMRPVGSREAKRRWGRVHVKAGVLIIVLGKRSCKILIAF